MDSTHQKNNPYRIMRIARDIKPSEIAEAIGVSRAYINLIENGTREPSLDTIKKYANALRIDMNTMFRIRELCKTENSFEFILMSALERIIALDEKPSHLTKNHHT